MEIKRVKLFPNNNDKSLKLTKYLNNKLLEQLHHELI